MATGIPPKKNTAFVFYISLVSQANPAVFQANPTLATGDVVVNGDGGAFANLATLPTVTPAAGKGVKVSLSAGEMNFDDVLVVFSDAAGAEWCDRSISIKTADRWINDLAFPATAGRSMLIDTAGGITLTNPQGIQKNTALTGFQFPMYTTAGVLATGKTVTEERSINGGAFAAMTNNSAEIGTTGVYQINLAAADTNGDTLFYMMTATGCVPTIIGPIKTRVP